MLFNGTSSRAESSGLGNISGVAGGGRTFAAKVRRNSTGTWDNIFGLLASGSTVFDLTISDANNLTVEGGGTANGPNIPTAGSYYVAADSAASSSWRFHKQIYGTDAAVAHSNGTGTATLASAASTVGLGTFNTNADWFDGDIHLVAVWGRQLSDAEHELLAAGGYSTWLSLAPVAIWVLDHESAPTLIKDISGGGADLTTVTNLAKSTVSYPAVIYNTPVFQVTRSAASGTNTYTADQASATAAGLTAAPKVTYTSTQASATAAGLTAAPKVTYTADQASATAAGIAAAPKVTYTATQASATAAGINADWSAAGAGYTATQGAATAAGIDATPKVTYTSTQASATAAGQSASPKVTYTADQASATAAGQTAAPKVTYTSTQASATATGQDAQWSFAGGGAAPDAPLICGPIGVTGPTRTTRPIGSIRLTRSIGIVYGTDVIGGAYSTDVTGSPRTSDSNGSDRDTDVIGPMRTTTIEDPC